MTTNLPIPQQPLAAKIDKTHYILQEEYSYTWRKDIASSDANQATYIDNKIVVPKGFRWDGASVPKAFWRLGFDPDGSHRAAALIHDFVYIYKGKMPTGSFYAKYEHAQHWEVNSGSFSRKDADRLFGKIMKESKVKSFTRKVMKFAVSKFGWMYWQDGPDLMRSAIYRFIQFVMVAGILIWMLIYK